MDEDGNLQVLYHGTVSDFTVFDRKFGNVENDMGVGFYFSNTQADVDTNYATEEGPDLKNKISRLAERIELEREIDYDKALEIARAELVKSDPRTLEVYVNTENPVVIGGEGETFFDFSEPYDEEYDEYGEPEGTLVDFIEALQAELREGDYSENNADVGAIWEEAYDGGLSAQRLIELVRERVIPYLEDAEGNLAQSEAIRAAFERMGFDGIIDSTVSEKFRMDGLNPDTKHVIVFNPEQVKLTMNGKPTKNPDIRFSLSADGDRVFHTPTGVEVVQNATDAEYRQMREDVLKQLPWLRGTGEPLLRHTYDEQGNEYHWAAHEAIHVQVEPYINEHYGTRTSQQWKWWEKPDKDDYPTDYKSPDRRYSITPEFEEWFKEGFASESERSEVQKGLDDLKQRYGTIPAGERAYRESQIPRSMTGKDRVSQAARTVYEAKATPAERLQTIEDVVAKGQVSDFPIENKITGNRARAKLKRDGWTKAYTDWISDVRAGKVSADLMAMGAHLLNNAGNNTEATAEQYAELFVEYAELNRNAGRSLQAARILKTLSPEGKLYGLQRYVDKMNEEAEQRASKKKGFDPEKWAKEQKITIDPELMQRYRDAKTDEERDVVMTELQQSIADQMPASLSEKLNNWRYLAMLGNFKTQGRNLIGNAMFQIPRLIKEDVRGIMEATAQLTGAKIERTTSVMRDGASFKAALNDFKDVRAIILNGGKVNEKADYLRGIDEKRRIYNNAMLEGYRKITNWAMDSGDALFCQFTYADSIARFMAANGITWDAAPETMREAARRRAIKEAAEATYRDSNDFSDLIARAGIRNPKNKFETVVNTLVEGILPFKKTPANILVRGLEYSPAGLLNTAFKAAQAKNADSDVTGADVINALAKTVTGTGLMALGYVLAKSGDLTGSGPDDEKEKEFWELQGGQDYSVRIGDTWLSVSFLAPEAIPVLVGANIAEQLMESDADKSAMDVVLQAFYKISDPMLELSMLSGINDMIESIEYAQQSGVVSMVANAVWSYLMQYVPSLLRQSEAASDNTRRSIYTDKNTEMPDVFQYPLGKLSQSIPGLDLYQIPYVDRWGRMENNRDSRIGNAFAQLLSPTYVSKDNTSDMEQELQRLYDVTGDTAVLPREMPKKVTIEGVDYNFTGDQYVDYATLRGQYAHDALVELMDSAAYRKLSDEQKIKAVTAVYDEAADIAKQDFVDRQGLDVDGGDKDEEPKLDTGLSNAEFLAVEARVKGIESLKDKDDETITNSEGLQIMEAVYGMDLRLSDSEYEALFEALGVGKTIRKKNKGQVANALTAMRKQAK